MAYSRSTATTRRPPRLHRAVGWLAIAQYAILCSGLPLPVWAERPAVVEGDAVPFPCQSHRCGCRTAEQCWKSCCCYTPAEKLTWAKANGVTPPEDASDAEAVSAVQKPCCVSADDSPKTCGSRPACCHAGSEAATETAASCCQASPNGSSQSSAVDWVAWIDAARCNGGDGAATWLNVPISLPVATTSSNIGCLHAQPFFLPVEPLWASAAFVPLDPPPRNA